MSLQVAVRTLGGRAFELSAKPSESVLSLTMRINDEDSKLHFDRQRLIFQGQVLPSNCRLSDLPVQEGIPVEMQMILLPREIRVVAATRRPPYRVEVRMPGSATVEELKGQLRRSIGDAGQAATVEAEDMVLSAIRPGRRKVERIMEEKVSLAELRDGQTTLDGALLLQCW